MWIGGTDRLVEGDFKWTDGSPFNASAIRFHPSDVGSEDYLSLVGAAWGPNSFVRLPRNKTHYNINDNPSSFLLPFVCTFTGSVTTSSQCLDCNIRIPSFSSYTFGCDWECKQGYHKALLSSNNTTCVPNTSVEPESGSNSNWTGNFWEEYSNCTMPYSWFEIIEDEMNQKFMTGGLGQMMDEDFESWVCVKNHSCAAASSVHDDAYFCFIYHEGKETFVPWGANKDLQLFSFND